MNDENNKSDIPIWEKYALTVEEASAYFNIGSKKIRRMIDENKGTVNEFSFYNGVKCLINRRKFEHYLDGVTVI